MLKVADHFWGTHTGRQRRHNEDNYYPQPPVFVVADGMGGAQAGEVASDLAVQAFKAGLPDDGSPEERLAEVIRAANQRIHAMAHADLERAGMGTTVVAAYLGDREVAIAHVGDARAYLFRDGELTPLTHDHTLVQALIDQGRITTEEAAVHPQRSIITRAVGPEPQVDVETHTFPLQPADVVLLCSDGLTSMVDEGAITDILRSTPKLKAAGRALIDAANAAGGRDNITVILFRLEDADTVDAGATQDFDAAADGVGEDTLIRPPADDGEVVAQRPAKPETGFMSALQAVETAEAPAAETARRRRLTPRGPGDSRAAARPRRHRRRWIAPVAIVCAVALLLGGAWIASRAVYFVGTDRQGFVTIYRGLPYDLPGGVHLYERFYTSGVPAEIVPVARRKKLLDHTLRSRNDAESLVNQLELGKLSQ
jgi:serine/threonine protein phosphatase PrpC